MGEAILLGTCLTGLQGLRGPLGWEPAEAAGTNNVVSKAAGVDIAYGEPGSRLPGSRGAGSHGAGCDDCLFFVYMHTSTAATQLSVN